LLANVAVAVFRSAVYLVDLPAFSVFLLDIVACIFLDVFPAVAIGFTGPSFGQVIMESICSASVFFVYRAMFEAARSTARARVVAAIALAALYSAATIPFAATRADDSQFSLIFAA